MLEKVGLPPKPSLKGNEWVLDASHCQGCSSAFSFFNRKHHCRRCGGIFCGNCTQQRMTLRGQGEGPVRICDPCKKLEDAARFETRYGHRNKAPKGNSKSNDMESDSLLKELLGHESNPQSPEKTELLNEVSELIAPRNIASTSMGHIAGMEKAGNDGNQSTPMTPEMLLLQAQEEKKQWLALKREGKGEEALQAFKRGRELERQAENLKLSLRRSQRKAASSTVKTEKHEEVSKSERRQKTGELTSGNTEGKADDGIGPTKSKRAVSKEPEEKDNLMDALKDMGWSDADLQDAGRKHSKAKTVESELAELAAAVHQGEGNNRQGATSSMEVLAHKRRALALKREGHLAEAKEELKKAKLMERQLEEQQMFGGEGEGEESDDDLTALIRGLDKENTTDTFGSVDLDVSMFGDIGDFDHDDNDEGMEVTDLDMDDPEMVAALRSMGWEEEATAMEKGITRTSAKPSVARHGDRTSFHGGAKGKKPAGEDIDFLDNMEERLDNVETTEDDMKDPYFLSALKAMGFEEEKPSKLMQPIIASIPKPYEKKSLQQQILFLKKEALLLKRSGKLQEAKEELRRAKQLEKELQEFQSHHTEEDVLAAFSLQQEAHGTEAEVIALPVDLHAFDDDAHTDNVDVTEEDMGDPELAKTLKSLGWQDDHETEGSADTEKEVEPSEQLFIASHQTKTRSELQKELLGIKRAALKLRREGKVEEAEDELRQAHILERFMEESGNAFVPKQGKHTYEQKVDGFINSEKKDKVSEGDMEDPTMLASLQKSSGWNEPNKDAKSKQSSILSSSTLDTSTITEKPSGERVGFEDMTHEKTSIFGRENSSGPEIISEQPCTLSKVRADSSFGLGNMQPADSGKEVLNIEGDKLSSTTVGVGFGGSLGSIGAEKGKDESSVPEAPTLSPRRNITKLTDVEVRNMLSQDSVREPPVNPLMPPHIVKGNNIGSVKSTATKVPSSVEALQQEILSLKRKALALKREGRQLEAKEQLREAKILEKKLAFEQSQPESPVMEEGDLPGRKFELEALLADTKVASSKQVRTSGTSVVASSSVAAQKHAVGKDRLKLQQESLAHKRKALGLRREGKTEEADVEFELAKSIEKQMEELGENAGHSAMPPSYSGDDVGSVDDIFDPQLLAALKGLGWKDTDILQPTPKVGQEGIEKAQMGNHGKATDAVSSTIIRVKKNDEKEQLEEKIRSEKVRAVQLKRLGQQSEALDVLRGAKQLERKLQSLS